MREPAPPDPRARDTTRLEAFSDGVFAIAITLLILEIRVPPVPTDASNARLWGDLVVLWPSLVAFTLSFFVILVMWVNHHELLRLVRTVDYPLLFANGFLLLMVTFVPFPTAVLARYLGTTAANAAAAFYCGTFFVISLAWGVVNAAIARHRRLVRADVPQALLGRVRRAYAVGPVVYAASVVVALWNAAAGLALCTSLWILWTRLRYHAEPRPLA
ncbi:MAG TPA: TMEM175 family protein [Gemmatimonadales bacterium]|nr:TMEM175 family protein [Gemmatimonadales bacterium]